MSQSESVLSAKNLGFPQGPTCDDVLLVGINERDGELQLYIHIIEVKIGKNDSFVIKKATSHIYLKLIYSSPKLLAGHNRLITVIENGSCSKTSS